ncbi:MAG: hypothetical protein R2827_13690, partial [Bdellovibrionales bacterium]
MEMLNEPLANPEDTSLIIDNLAYAAYLSREDVQEAYDLSELQGRRDFTYWYLANILPQALNRENLFTVYNVKFTQLPHDELAYVWSLLKCDFSAEMLKRFPECYWKTLSRPLRDFPDSPVYLLGAAMWLFPDENNLSIVEKFEKPEQLRRLFDDWLYKQPYDKYEYICRRLNLNSTLRQKPTETEKPAQTTKSATAKVNVVGFARTEFGLGEDCKLTSLSLLKNNTSISVYDVEYLSSRSNKKHEVLEPYIQRNLPAKINIFNMPGTEQYKLRYTQSLNLFSSKYNIGYWPWELPRWKTEFDFCFECVDEIWASSKFIQECFENSTGKPVLHMPLPVDISRNEKFNRNHFGLNDGKFYFLFIFDSNSFTSRKNPYACIEAFYKAFPRDLNEVGLVIKTMNPNPDDSLW